MKKRGAAQTRADGRPDAAPTRRSALHRIAASFAAQQPHRRRAAMGMAASGARPPPDAGVVRLPLDDVRSKLEAHPIVKELSRLGVEAGKVHAHMVQLLALPSSAEAGKRAPSAPPAPSAPAGEAGRQGMRSGCCGAEMEVTSDRSAHACSGCGLLQSVNIDYRSHYRHFADDRAEGKADPAHWSRVPEQQEAEEAEWDEVAQLQPLAFAGRATDVQARSVHASIRALRWYGGGRGVRWQPATDAEAASGRELVHPALSSALRDRSDFSPEEWSSLGVPPLCPDHVVRVGPCAWLRPVPRPFPQRLAASAAAWIVAENPSVLTDRRVGMTASDLPRAPFACPHCPEAFYSRRDLRVHAPRCPQRCAAASR